ncbi:MAG: copper resistance protein B [Porticoccaceae bacterium]
MMNKQMKRIATVLAFGMSAVWAQDPATSPRMDKVESADSGQSTKAEEMEPTPGIDHSQMNHGDAASRKTGDAGNIDDGGTDHGSMSMQGGSPPPAARDPHAYSGGHDFGPLKLHLADEHSMGSLLVDNLEMMRTKDNTSAEYDLQAWYGRTYDRAVLKAEGEVDDGRFEQSHELLWGHAIAAFWDAQLGARYDSGLGPDRRWLAFAVQGLAPYWFNVDTAAYVGENGRSALRLDAEYELLLTQKLILQPKVETDFYGKSDAARGLGSGLSDVSVALRLRYEIRREFAPYIGIERVRKFGETADFARAAGKDTGETRFLAGVRFWF